MKQKPIKKYRIYAAIALLLLSISGYLVYSGYYTKSKGGGQASWQAIGYNQFSPSKFSANNEVVIELWSSPQGIERLERAQFKEDFYQLAGVFQPQINPLYCGIAASVIVLNALRLENGRIPSQEVFEVAKPKIWGGNKIAYRSYSQYTFLNEETDHIKPRQIINLQNITPENENDAKNFDPGLTLENLRAILASVYDLNVVKKYASNIANQEGQSTIDEFREDLKKYLAERKHFIIVNFHGKSIGAKTGGHISPLAAYDEINDMIMVMDVAGHKNPWYWVPAYHLYQSMNTKDGQFHRGYLIVSEKN